MVTTKEKCVIDMQMIMIKDSKCIVSKSHQITAEDSKTGSKERRIYKTENDEQNDNGKPLSINNLFKYK